MGETDFPRVGLEAAWNQADTAAKRSGGQLRGVVRWDALVSAEPQWVAWSERDSKEPPIEGRGDTPADALLALGKALSEE